MDTFVDSSWYFLRFPSVDREDIAIDPVELRRWAPVDHYTGGVEHAILHLLYSRFITKVLFDLGYVEFVEPFRALHNQGQVINQGKSMSKSLGNGVDLGAELAAYGVDAIRLTMLFAGPPDEDIDWSDVSPTGSGKFLARAWRLARDVTSAPGTDPATGDVALRATTHRSVAEIRSLVDAFRFNVAVARLMELVNAARKAIDSGPGPDDPAVREAAEAVAIMLSLFAPYCAEDMWASLGHDATVALAGWPVVDPALLVQESVTAVVQVAGKVRARLSVPPDVSEDALRALALADPAVARALGERPVRTVVVRPPKLVNVVPG
jgi:leucyl-tRNA synthetase